MQDSERDTDVKNRLLDSMGEGEGGMISENSIGTGEPGGLLSLGSHRVGHD